MNPLDLEVLRPGAATPLVVMPRRLINAGYVGRDQDAVRRHIEELRHEGVAPPPAVPMLFPLACRNVTTAGRIEVSEARTSGEVEFVLLVDGDRILVGIGSDHTDRPLEAHDVLKSKQACPNVMGRSLWDYADIRGHWDRLLLQSWVQATPADAWTPYQHAPVSTILPPERILELVRSRLTDQRLDGTIVFSGTIPIQNGRVTFGCGFRCALADPVLGRSLHCAYEIVHLDYLGPVPAPAMG